MCVKLSCDGLMFACWCVVLTALRSFCLLLLVFLARSLFFKVGVFGSVDQIGSSGFWGLGWPVEDFCLACFRTKNRLMSCD